MYVYDTPVYSFADSGSKITLAGFLPVSDQILKETTRTFSYADGVPREEKVIESSVEIIVHGKRIPITFTVFPECASTQNVIRNTLSAER